MAFLLASDTDPGRKVHPKRTESPDDQADRPGYEMGDDAQVWRVYNNVVSIEDEERTRAWNRGLDGIGLFAGVFLGVTTAFIIESYKLMQPDYAALTYRTLVANAAHMAPPSDDDFVIPVTARIVNCLWFTSLMLSLSAALIAVMGKEWSAAYYDPESDPNLDKLTPRQRADRRQYRSENVRQWHMPTIILTAPILMRFSLLLFGCGLVVFVVIIDSISGYVTLAFAAFSGLMWAFTTFNPFVARGSPFRSPLTPMWRSLLFSFVSHVASAFGALFSLSTARENRCSLMSHSRGLSSGEDHRGLPSLLMGWWSRDSSEPPLNDPWMSPEKRPSSITGAMRTSPGDLLDIHSDLWPIRLLFDKICYRSLLRLCTLPDTHPLSTHIQRTSRRLVKTHPSPLHILFDTYKLKPQKTEKIKPYRQNTKTELAFSTKIASSRPAGVEAAKEMEGSSRMVVYTDGSADESSVGAAAVLYRDGEEEDTLLFHLGSTAEHTTYEAEAVGVILGLHLLAKAAHLDTTALAIDNTGVICQESR